MMQPASLAHQRNYRGGERDTRGLLGQEVSDTLTGMPCCQQALC